MTARLAVRFADQVKEHFSSSQGILWATLSTATVVIWALMSQGHRSFLLTVASMASVGSFLTVVLGIEQSRSSEGVSALMFELFAQSFIARGVCLWLDQGYVPVDATGTHVYPALETACGLISAYIVYQCRCRFPKDDGETSRLNRLMLIVPSLVLGCIFHPGRARSSFLDVCWTFALCLESVAVLPQLFLFMEQNKVVPFTSHFLATQALAKVLNAVFWFRIAAKLSRHKASQSVIAPWIGSFVIGVQLLMLLLLADFLYHYLQCLRRGSPMSKMLFEYV